MLLLRQCSYQQRRSTINIMVSSALKRFLRHKLIMLALPQTVDTTRVLRDAPKHLLVSIIAGNCVHDPGYAFSALVSLHPGNAEQVSSGFPSVFARTLFHRLDSEYINQ